MINLPINLLIYNSIYIFQLNSRYQDSVYFNRVQLATAAIDVEWKFLDKMWHEFNNDSEPRDVNLMSFGNPHFSCQDIREVAKLCKGRIEKTDVAMMVTCDRAQYVLAS